VAKKWDKKWDIPKRAPIFSNQVIFQASQNMERSSKNLAKSGKSEQISKKVG
jgi:hypothetical protein